MYIYIYTHTYICIYTIVIYNVLFVFVTTKGSPAVCIAFAHLSKGRFYLYSSVVICFWVYSTETYSHEGSACFRTS